MTFPFVNPWGISYGDPSNLRPTTNPAYAVTDFLAFYPQFGNDSSGNPIVPTNVIQQYINMANGSLNYRRYYSQWQVAMGLYVAHFCTLWAQSYVDPSNGASAVAEAGKAQGVLTGESVGDVSYSADTGTTSIEGAGHWNLTSYGQQLVQMAKIAGIGGMQVW